MRGKNIVSSKIDFERLVDELSEKYPSMSFENNISTVDGDESLVKILLINLIENAVREDSLAELIADGKTIMISNRAYDITQYDVFKMNSGVRIDDSKIKGHGIGMELCREIVKSHGRNMKYYFDEGVIQVTIVVN